jgi:hypothetical protein
MKGFKNLTVDMIEEGRLRDEMERGFETLQKHMCKYAQRYGVAAEGATAELIVKLKIKLVSADDGVYTVRSDISSKVPGQPAMLSMAIAAEADDGEAVLFARASGATAGNPRQLRLTTDAGEVVNPETGEVKQQA